MTTTFAPFRIAVLLCDTPNPAVLAAYGDYGAVFRTLFQNSLQSLKKSAPETQLDFIIDSYDVRYKLEYPTDVDQYDAVLLTGSGAYLVVVKIIGPRY